MAGTITYSYFRPTAFGRYNCLTGVNCPLLWNEVSLNTEGIQQSDLWLWTYNKVNGSPIACDVVKLNLALKTNTKPKKVEGKRQAGVRQSDLWKKSLRNTVGLN